jgi:hypothetical protein
MNITPTQFVQVPLEGTATNLDIVVQPFSLFPNQIEVRWTVYGEGFSKSGTLILPQSIVDQWGVDDTIVQTYVLEQLNLTQTN